MTVVFRLTQETGRSENRFVPLGQFLGARFVRGHTGPSFGPTDALVLSCVGGAVVVALTTQERLLLARNLLKNVADDAREGR